MGQSIKNNIQLKKDLLPQPAKEKSENDDE